MELKFLQTSDWHLGTKLSSFDKPCADFMRESTIKSLRKIIETAIQESVNLVLLPGDLFNTGKPSLETRTTLLKLLKQIPSEIQIFIIPGTHDFYSPKGLWDTNDFTNFHVFKERGFSSVTVESLNLCIWGVPVLSAERDKNWLENAPDIDDSRINILLYHGDYRGLGREYDKWDFPFELNDVTKSPFDYIALGHHHSAKTIEVNGKIKAAYSGSPVGWSFRTSELGERKYIMGEISKDGVKIESRDVDTPLIQQLEVNTSKPSDVSSALDSIKSISTNDILRIKISGSADPLGFHEKLESLKQSYKWLYIVDDTVEQIDASDNYHLKSLLESLDEDFADGRIDQDFLERVKKRVLELFSQ